MRIRFWGTRGSLAKPGPRTVRYGGNTSCVEATAPDGTRILLDCGTGAHDLGQHLMASASGPINGHLLITHTHWDHIQGFPFFGPLFARGNEWDVYAPQGLGQRLEETLGGQMEYSYFPVALAQLAATIRYHEVVEGVFDLGAVRVSARYLNHPGLAMGYRLEVGGVAAVYSTDHEPHSRHQGDSGGVAPVHREDQRHIEWLTGADLVIHDAQYTLQEYPQRLGWGHSPAELVVDWALAAGVKRLALFHHDPLRSDDAVDTLLAGCRQRVAAAGGRLEVVGAAEGQVFELAERAVPSRAPGESGALEAPDATPASASILIVDDEPEIVRLLTMTLEPGGFRLLTAGDGDTALAIARTQVPDLLLLDWNIPGRNGLEVCRALRTDADPRLREVPVVLLTAETNADATAAGFAAGITDYVTKPFKPAHIVTRVQTWLLRGRQRGG